MKDPYLDSVLKAIAADALDPEGPRLITVDELRAAGALDVPAAWRKSLGGGEVERDLFSDLIEDDDTDPKKLKPTPGDAEARSSADELL